MTTVDRRRFLELGGLAGVLGVGLPELTSGAQAERQAGAATDADDRRVYMTGDGLSLTTGQYARLLSRLADERGLAPDSYILGGVVEEMETRFARILGKERAVFMPTGTLANQLAVRALAGGSSRAIVQAESHLYMDSGDCVQTLSNITLMPLAPGRATFTADDVQRVIGDTRGGRVVPRVSVLQIETPVRRRQGETFDDREMAEVIALARREGIKLHLDGARLFLQAGYTGRSVADYTAPFDTVYVSLYKYFNAAAGAILAGPRALLDDMFHTRRMYGGALYQAWPYAAVALHYLDGFSERFTRAIGVSEDLIRALGRVDGVTVERVPAGTNLFRLRVTRTDAVALQKRLAARGIVLANPSANGTFLVGVNESWNRTTGAELADAFVRETA
jgi:threonine aldolase